MTEGKKYTQSTPRCVGVIMDGNRTWAKANDISIADGYRAGYETLRQFVEWVSATEITHIIAYAFSTENWQRPADQLAPLMKIFRHALSHELEVLMKHNVRLRFVGQIERFASDIQQLIRDAQGRTADATGPTLVLAMSYGGRAEIAAAANSLVHEGITITEEKLTDRLWMSDIPDPDLIIRTSGQRRLSNFLPWQSAYSELFFTDTLWPDFTEDEFQTMLGEYATRQRNFGK